LEKEEAKRLKLKELGINYEYPGFVNQTYSKLMIETYYR